MTGFMIRRFEVADQPSVESLVLEIQQDEFGLALSAANQPDLADVAAYFAAPGSTFLVACDSATGKVIGCIGLEYLPGQTAVMRKFMVAEGWRGKQTGVAAALHSAFLQAARDAGAARVALSTVATTVAAQAFYRRSGYHEVPRDAMPDGFVPGILDVVFMVQTV